MTIDVDMTANDDRSLRRIKYMSIRHQRPAIFTSRGDLTVGEEHVSGIRINSTAIFSSAVIILLGASEDYSW
jgi:hypothetical protein